MKANIAYIAISSALIVVWATVAAPAANSDALAQFAGLQPQSLNHTGVYSLRQLEPDLTGADVKVAVVCRSITYIDGIPQNDYRPNISHNCLKSANLSFHDQGTMAPGTSPHSTAICSILFGNDANASDSTLGKFNYQGIVPDAEGRIYEFWHFLINNVSPQAAPDADVITLGIGTLFEDWWTRGIEAMAEHYGIPVVASIGNGSTAGDPVLYPGASANGIGVGVVNSVNTDSLATSLANFALAYPESSSGGLTGDGRSKPDIVAPSNSLASDANGVDAYEATGNWSSFSTPVVAGTTALLVQKAKQDSTLRAAVSPQGGNCVIKAILMNSATKLPYWHKGLLSTEDDHTAPLDYMQGAGMVNASAAYEQLTAGQNAPGKAPAAGWDNNRLDRTSEPVNIYRISVPEPAGKRIAATAAWNKHYTRMYPFAALPRKNSDLRLEVWAIDPNNTERGYLLDYSDSAVDNVEHIFCEADPNFTEYEIVISFSDLEGDHADVLQQYGLAWNVTATANDSSIFWHDINADGIVDKTDLSTALQNWADKIESPQNYRFADVNSDGVVDANDLGAILNNLNRTADWYSTTPQ